MGSNPTYRCDSLRLADGRVLALRQTGPRDGIPVLYCHGAIGTPLGRSVDLEAITLDLGIRHVAVSRPGVGGSAPAPGRTVIDFAADVQELADRLQIGRLAIVGVSAGGPYALAIARELGERVTRVAVCSSLSPMTPHRTPEMQRRIRIALALIARAPGLCGAIGDSALPVIRRHPELLSRVIAAHAAPGERDRLRRADERRAASDSFLQATSAGVGGLIEDYLICCRDWGFTAGEVACDVHLWHGLNDPLVPVEHALQLALTLPRCRVFLDPDEGHHFFRRRLPTILAALVDRDLDGGAGLATSLACARTLAASCAAPSSHGSVLGIRGYRPGED